MLKMRYKTIMATILASLAFVAPVCADNSANKPVLDTVVFQLSAERWVKTSQATVIVNINANLDKIGLTKARNDILANLKRIADADWQITQFDRSQDSSGLERLTVSAQARLDEVALKDARQTAKSISKPGAAYNIQHIDFRPNLADVEKVRAELRASIYNQAQAELKALHQAAPKRSFKLHTINFVPGYHPMRKARMVETQDAMLAAASTIEVSNKVAMTATVVLAEVRDLDNDD